MASRQDSQQADLQDPACRLASLERALIAALKDRRIEVSISELSNKGVVTLLRERYQNR